MYITPSRLQGTLSVPSSKSHTLRALLFAALSKGISQIDRPLRSPDTLAMIEGIRQFGAEVWEENERIFVRGCSGKPKCPDDVIQCGNSGLMLRLLSGIAALLPEYTIVTGDHSIRHNRPMKPLLSALDQLGVFATSSRGDGFAPVLIRGPIVCDHATLDGTDSQPVSALLIASSFALHPIRIEVEQPGEKPWIDFTLHWLKRVGIEVAREGYTHFSTKGSAQIEPFSMTIPGDFSTAAFPIAAALLTNSELVLNHLDPEDPQGDKALIAILQQMGARITFDQNHLIVERGDRLRGMRIDVNPFIDALPILAVLGCFAEGRTELVNGA